MLCLNTFPASNRWVLTLFPVHYFPFLASLSHLHHLLFHSVLTLVSVLVQNMFDSVYFSSKCVSNKNPNSLIKKSMFCLSVFVCFNYKNLEAGHLRLELWLHNVKDSTCFSLLVPPSLASCLWSLYIDVARSTFVLKAGKQKEEKVLASNG